MSFMYNPFPFDDPKPINRPKLSEETINASIIELKETFIQTIHGQQEKMVEAINNNTLVMQRLVDKLDGGK